MTFLYHIIAMLDTAGKIVVKYVYDAWGNHKVYNAGGTEINDATHIGYLNPFRYRGYYYDVETGLYYLQTRYYDPVIGRFISQDDISYTDPETINGLNLYAYCGNNPVMAVDPEGTAWWHWLVGALVVVGLAVATVISAGGVGVAALAITSAVYGISAATVSATTTVLAFATVGAGVALAASAGVAAIYGADSWAQTGKFSSGVNTFVDYGETALWSTVGGGITGGIGGYITYKQQIGNYSQSGFMTKKQRDIQRRQFWISQASDPTSRFYENNRAIMGLTPEGYQINHIYGTYGTNRNYIVIMTIEEHRYFHSIYGYKTAGGPFYRYNPDFINFWEYIRGFLHV